MKPSLRNSTRYWPGVTPAPPGRAPVDSFLFDLKAAFCESFASSMAVMLREVGVPARVVEGFTAGELDPLGRYAVKELNAHAWVEAYFPQYGWIEFEPTPSELPFDRVDAAAGATAGGDSTTGRNGREDATGLAGRDTEPDPGIGGPDDTPPDVSGTVSRAVDPRPALALVSALLLVLFIALVRFEMRFRGLGEIDTAWGKTRLLGAYAGHAAQPSQTPYEYADAMGREIPDVQVPLRTIAHARVQDRYSPARATDSERAAAAAARPLGSRGGGARAPAPPPGPGGAAGAGPAGGGAPAGARPAPAEGGRAARGYPRGGAPPFAHAADLPVLVDERLFAFATVW